MTADADAISVPTTARSDALLASCLSLAAVALGHAIQLSDGEYSLPGESLLIAIHWVGIALVLTAAGVWISRRTPRWPSERVVPGVVAGGVAIQFLQLLTSPLSGSHDWSDDLKLNGAPTPRGFTIGLSIAAILCVGLLARSARVRKLCLPAILLVHLLLGIAMIRACPAPFIDVYVFQQQGSAALLDGKNPYTVAFPDIYTLKEPEKTPPYGEKLTKDGALAFGFPYLPVSLLMSTAGYAVAGDFRYAQVVAMTLAGALLAYARPGRRAALAAVLLLFTPRAFFILGRGWSEPYVVCLLAATVFCACRRSRALPIALGLFLASKQYLALALPAVLLLAAWTGDRRGAIRLAWQTALVALLVTLPLALWDWHAFWFSTVTVQAAAPFRKDALSYLAWWRWNFPNAPLLGRPLESLGGSVAFAMTLPAMLLAFWRAPRTPAGFAAALALTFLPFLAFNKQAFANYYYFAIGCLCAAIAATDPAEKPTTPKAAPT